MTRSIIHRHNIKTCGKGDVPMLFLHGYGCDQNMWRFLVPAFKQDYRIVLYDLAGSGGSDLTAYSRRRHGTLHGHADDLLEICDALGLGGAVVVGHSVSAMISALAAIKRPELFSKLVMIGPSPCYMNDDGYTGGFNRADLEGLLEFLDSNFLGWSRQIAPAIMGVPQRPELAEELTASFCRTDPEIAQHFGKVTFLSDHRADIAELAAPTLILQCSDDIVAPVAVGEWMHRAIPDSELVVMEATGHCPHLSAPEETIRNMKAYLA